MPPETEEIPVENTTSVETIAEDLGKMTEEAAQEPAGEASEDSVEAVFEDVYEEDEEGKIEEASVEAAPAEEKKEEPAPATEAVVPAVVEATTEPESDPSQEEQPASVASKEPELAAAPEPEKKDERSRAEIRDGLIAEITNRYIISEEDTEVLRVEPEKILPKLAGQMFVDVYEAVYSGVMSQITPIVQGLIKQTSVASTNQDAFFDEFPTLNDTKYAEQLSQIGTMWRKSYPEATREQAIKGIGTTAMAMLGLTKAPPEKQDAAPVAKPKLPSVPAAAAVSSGELKPDSPEDPLKVLEILDYELPDI